MKRTKLALTIMGLFILTVIALGFWLKDQFEPGLWTFWFIAFNGTLGIYAGANVAQKKVLKDDKTKAQD